MPWTPPTSAKHITLFPVSAGMVLEAVGEALKAFSVRKAIGYVPTQAGLRTFPGFTEVLSYVFSSDPSNRIVNVSYYSDPTTRNTYLLITTLTSSYIYNGATLTQVTWSEGLNVTVKAPNTVSLDSGIVDDYFIQPGDTIVLSGVTHTITAAYGVDITFVPNTTIAPGTPVSATLYRWWSELGSGIVPDVAIAGSKFIITDTRRPLLTIDPLTSSISKYITQKEHFFGEEEEFICEAISYFDDRLWCGGITTPTEGYIPNRIIWSQPLQPYNFSSGDFIDLPGQIQYIYDIAPSVDGTDDFIAVYGPDAIFVGLRTNSAYAPFIFFPLESHGYGIVGKNAWAHFNGGHLLICRDGFYFLKGTKREQIPCPILREVDLDTSRSYLSSIAFVPQEGVVLFHIPQDNPNKPSTVVWNYKDNLWAMLDFGDPDIISTIPELKKPTATFDNLSLSIDEVEETYSFANPQTDTPNKLQLALFDSSQGIYRLDYASNTDWTGATRSIIIETHDIDFGNPILSKTIYRLEVRVVREDSDFTTPIAFDVEYSTDGSETWQSAGTLTIEGDRGYLSLLTSGATFRFRFTTTAPITHYTFQSLTLTVRGAGIDYTTTTGRPTT